MKPGHLFASAVVFCCALTPPAQPQQPGAPQGNGPLLLSAEGVGLQVYRCADTGGTAGWVLDHPDAELRSSAGNVVGKHFAGPTWRYKDGSEVVGAVLSRKPGQTPRDAPWLRLRAVAHHGQGFFTKVETIERTETRGGNTPPAGCDAAEAGKLQSVPYKALYRFYARP